MPAFAEGGHARVPEMDDAMSRCIDLCVTSEAFCPEAARSCLDKGGRHAERDYVNLLLACAESCRISARFLLLRSEFHVLMCGVCADVCEGCADDTESKGSPDPVLKRCIDALRKCAAACREMACLPPHPKRRSRPRPTVRAVAGADARTRRPILAR